MTSLVSCIVHRVQLCQYLQLCGFLEIIETIPIVNHARATLENWLTMMVWAF